MCTAVSLLGKQHYFGRNLDLEYGYREQVAVTPRNYTFHLRNCRKMERHFAMIGMATVEDGYPLYYEATNEHGLSMAGLNFPQLAVYRSKCPDKDNLAPYELIPWVLGQCETVAQARQLLRRTNVWVVPFSRRYPLTPLHYLIADPMEAMTAEPMADGLRLYDNPVGVLTNAPPFPWHMYHLANFMQLQNGPAENKAGFASVKPYSNGMGAMGLPGDYSSASRFVKAAFVKTNTPKEDCSVSQFFHMLSSVAMPLGSVRPRGTDFEITRYCSCCDTTAGIYYYTTYQNRRIRAVDMHKCDLNSGQVEAFDLLDREDIFYQN